MGQITNKIRNLLYFLIIGWVLWFVELYQKNQKLKQQILIDNYEMKKKEIENESSSKSIDDLITDMESRYKGSGEKKN